MREMRLKKREITDPEILREILESGCADRGDG